MSKRNKQRKSSKRKQAYVVIFTSSSYWTIKAGSMDDIARRVNWPAVDLWLRSNSIFAAAVHKSLAELLTVNWACQDAQLIQRLCQAIVILCIHTGGPDSPCTTVNGCICQWGFAALAAMEALSVIYWRRWVIGFVSSRFLQRGCFHTDFVLAEFSVQVVHTAAANKLSDKVKGSKGPGKS